MHEGEEVLGFFLEACGDSAVMLQLRPEAFDQVSVLVSRPIGLSWRLRVRPAGHHGLTALVFHSGLRVVPFVRNHGLERQPLDQRFRLRHVGRLARGQNQPDWQPQPIHGGVDLGSEATSAAAQLLIGLASGAVRFFSAPAAQGWARITVESRISHSTSESCNTSNTAFQIPFRAQRSNRLQREFQ